MSAPVRQGLAPDVLRKKCQQRQNKRLHRAAELEARARQLRRRRVSRKAGLVMGQIRKRGAVYWIRYYRNGVAAGGIRRERQEDRSRSICCGCARARSRAGRRVTPKMQRLRFDEAAAGRRQRLPGQRPGLARRSRAADPETSGAVLRRPAHGGDRQRRTCGPTSSSGRRADGHDRRRLQLHAGGWPRHQHSGTRTRDRRASRTREINRELTILRADLQPRDREREADARAVHPAPAGTQRADGVLRARAISRRAAPLAGGAATRDRVCLHHRLADRLRSLAAPMAPGRFRRRRSPTRRRTRRRTTSGRVFPLTDDLRALLEAQQAEHLAADRRPATSVPWVFFRDGRERPRRPEAPAAIHRVQRRRGRPPAIAAGVPGRIPHDLRRTAIRNMVRRGVPERVAMQLTGHKTRSIFERYNIVSRAICAAAADAAFRADRDKKGTIRRSVPPNGESEIARIR